MSVPAEFPIRIDPSVPPGTIYLVNTLNTVVHGVPLGAIWAILDLRWR